MKEDTATKQASIEATINSNNEKLQKDMDVLKESISEIA